ncbi:MAG: hypothetical protein ACK4NA_00695 [Alphaproteobacteria bacterium]
MIAKLTLTAAALAASLIAVPAFSQTAQAPATAQQPPRPAGAPAMPQVNPNAYNAIDNIRKQWDAARAEYIKAQQAEIAARNNYERMTGQYLNVLNATVMKAPPPPPIQFNMQAPPAGQPGQPMPQPPAGGAPRP